MAVLNQRLLKKIAQWETVTGRKITKDKLSAFIEADLAEQYDRQAQTKSLELQERGLDIQETEAQSLAASREATLGLQTEQLNLQQQIQASNEEFKERELALNEEELAINKAYNERILGLQEISQEDLASFREESLALQAAGQAENARQFDEAQSLRERALEAEEGAATVSGIGSLLTAAGTGALVLKGTGLGELVGLGSSTASAGEIVSAGTKAIIDPVTGIATGETVAANASGIAAPSTGMSLGTGAGIYTAGVFGGRLLGDFLGDAKTGGILGGVGTGAYIGMSVGGPVGAVVGGLLGGIGGFLSDSLGSIICTEMWIQGKLPKELLELDNKWRLENVSETAYEGYLKLARPIVLRLRIDDEFARKLEPFVRAFAEEAASQVSKEHRHLTNKLGKAIINIGLPLCEAVGMES